MLNFTPSSLYTLLTQFPDHRNVPSSQVLHHCRHRAKDSGYSQAGPAQGSWKNGARIILACKSIDSTGADVFTPHYVSGPRNKEDESALTLTGRFEITKGQIDCEVLYDTTSSSTKDQWKAIKNATKLN